LALQKKGREVLVRMKEVVNSLERRHIKKRLTVLKYEIDYELATLHDAMVEKNEEKMAKSKQKLEQYRKELFRLNRSSR
jgi:t-SNARE complex subunit (syntaxin)